MDKGVRVTLVCLLVILQLIKFQLVMPFIHNSVKNEQFLAYIPKYVPNDWKAYILTSRYCLCENHEPLFSFLYSHCLLWAQWFVSVMSGEYDCFLAYDRDHIMPQNCRNHYDFFTVGNNKQLLLYLTEYRHRAYILWRCKLVIQFIKDLTL